MSDLTLNIILDSLAFRSAAYKYVNYFQTDLKFHSCLSCRQVNPDSAFFTIVNAAAGQNWGFAFSHGYPKG